MIDSHYTAYVVAVFVALPILKIVLAKELPPYSRGHVVRGVAGLAVATGFFYLSLHDDWDPYRLHHGLAQVKVFLQSYIGAESLSKALLAQLCFSSHDFCSLFISSHVFPAVVCRCSAVLFVADSAAQLVQEERRHAAGLQQESIASMVIICATLEITDQKITQE